MAQKYKVKNTTILHNKKTYAEGSIISLEDVEAKRLEDFVELIPNQAPATPQTNKASTKSAGKNTTKTEVKTEPQEGEGENGGTDDK